MKLLLFLLSPFLFYSQTEGFSENKDHSQTFYRVYGSGFPLLVINGGPGMNSKGFETLVETLSENRQVILYDQRGTGKSTLEKIDASTISMDLMIDDMESLRKHLGIQKWNLLGHSFGGMLASYYATKHPEAIEKMILSSSGGIDLGLLSYVNKRIYSKLNKTERDSLAYWNSKIAGGDTIPRVRLGRGRALAPAYIFDRKNIPVLAERLTQGNADINELLWNNMRKIDFDCAPALKNYDKPVLIVQGKQDIIKIETAEIAHKAFKNSKIILFKNCGHIGWLDAKDDYFFEISDFLKPS